MKKIVITIINVLLLTVSFGFGANITTNKVSSLTTNCDGGTRARTYYLGKTSNRIFYDTIKGSTNKNYIIGRSSSYLNIYNPFNALEFQNGGAFVYKSEIKPKGLDTVIVCSQEHGAGTKIANHANNRGDIAAQLVFNIKRKTGVGTQSTTTTYQYMKTDYSVGTISTNSARSTNVVSDNECLNIYIGRCGDGVLDNGKSTVEYSKVTNAGILGGEEFCDDGKKNSDTIPGACKLDCSGFVPKVTTEIDIEKILVNNILYRSGDLVTFKMDFVNKGPGVNHNVIITDYMPDSLTYVSSSIKMDDLSIIPLFEKKIENNVETIIYRGFNLDVGKGGYIILTGKVKGIESLNYINNVFIKSDEDDDHARAKFDIYTPTTILTIDKTINKSLFNLGEVVNFTIAVKNNGPTTISGLQIQDVWPDTSCILPSSIRSSDHELSMTNPNNPYTRTYNKTFNIGEIIYLYLSGQVNNNINCVKNYINTGNLTYTILGQQKFMEDSVPFSVVTQQENNQCKSISVANTIIKLDSNYKGSTAVRCETTGQPGNIDIDCGNGEKYSTSNSTYLNTTCNYTETNYPKNYTISCKVNNIGSPNCNQVILLDKSGGGGGGGGYCGNGRLDGFESCDITDSERAYRGRKYDGRYYIIGDRADNGRHNISNKYDDGRYYCKNCGIKGLPGEERYTPQACFNTQTTISVQKGEYLPFRWNLENTEDMLDGDSCDSDGSDDGKILKDTLKCNFKVYNGKNSDSDENPVLEISKDCDIDERDNKKLFDYFENSNIYRSLDDAFGKYFLEVNDFAKDNVYGEYKLALDSVNYEYCDENNEKKGVVVERVCEVDFAVTKPYIAQKSTFNIKPKSTNLKLEGYYDILGNELIDKTDLKNIMILDEGQYNASNNIYTSMINFTKKYQKLAIKIDRSLVSSLIESNSSVQVSKVPNQQIYIFEGNGTLKLKELGNIEKPFTMIVKGLDLIVKGSLTKTNGMFLVDGGKIFFEESDTNRCQKTQTVQGIFVTNKGFGSNNSNIYQKTINDNLNNPRCVYGGLKIKGVLIGNDIESIIMSRRSQLNHRFTVSSINDNAVKTERRNEIFNGASLLIEYSPSLRETLPPGASEFTKSLEVYKN